MRYLIALIVLLVTGCSYSPTFGDLTCEDEGATRAGQRCVGGVWVAADVGLGPDAGHSGDGGDDPDQNCASSESDSAFCDRIGRNCGEVTATDNCGVERTADCGACDADGESCEDNVCTLVPESDEDFCERAGATCGSLTAEDNTGAMRTVDSCGDCVAGLECGVGENIGPNTCGCADADDGDFCEDNGDAECGLVTANDPDCGDVERTVNCGMCAAPETCGGDGDDNQCGCMETNAAFCARLALNCGMVTADDVCGDERTVDCGTCTAPESCGGGPAGTENVCGCDVAEACALNGGECGMIDVVGMCSNIDTADCGGCGSEGVCDLVVNTCTCSAGYAFAGTECADIDECSTNTDMCDPNATCMNTPGAYDCMCNAGFSGDGFTCVGASAPTVEEIVTDTGNTSGPFTPPITAVDDDLYLAFVSIRTAGREVTAVNGLGLTWQRAVEQCDGEDGQALEVWWARGATATDSNVAVTLSGPPLASAAAVYRITGVRAGVGAPFVTRASNRNGVNGLCNNGGTSANYLYAYTPQTANSLILSATAIRAASHTPGVIWTEDEELHREDAGLATMQYTSSATTAITVTGSFGTNIDYANILLEIPGG